MRHTGGMPASNGLRIILQMAGSKSTVEINIPGAVSATAKTEVLNNDFPTYVCVTGPKREHTGSLMSALDKAQRNP